MDNGAHGCCVVAPRVACLASAKGRHRATARLVRSQPCGFDSTRSLASPCPVPIGMDPVGRHAERHASDWCFRPCLSERSTKPKLPDRTQLMRRLTLPLYAGRVATVRETTSVETENGYHHDRSNRHNGRHAGNDHQQSI